MEALGGHEHRKIWQFAKRTCPAPSWRALTRSEAGFSGCPGFSGWGLLADTNIGKVDIANGDDGTTKNRVDSPLNLSANALRLTKKGTKT